MSFLDSCLYYGANILLLGTPWLARVIITRAIVHAQYGK